jgi:hypothetical protein
MTNSLHPLDAIAFQAPTLITVVRESIWIKFVREPDAAFMSELKKMFDRPGYKFKRSQYSSCPLQFDIDCHPSINLANVVDFIAEEFDRHGLKCKIHFSPAGQHHLAGRTKND